MGAKEIHRMALMMFWKEYRKRTSHLIYLEKNIKTKSFSPKHERKFKKTTLNRQVFNERNL